MQAGRWVQVIPSTRPLRELSIVLQNSMRLLLVSIGLQPIVACYSGFEHTWTTIEITVVFFNF